MQKIRVLRSKRDQELKINSLIFRQKKTQKMTYEWAQKEGGKMMKKGLKNKLQFAQILTKE